MVGLCLTNQLSGLTQARYIERASQKQTLLIETRQGLKYRVSDKGDRSIAQNLKGDKHRARKNV